MDDKMYEDIKDGYTCPEYADDIINLIPTSEIYERPQGEWIPTVIDTGLFERSVCREWQCSNCGEVVKMKYPFCHCGAVMRVKDELNNELNNELNELGGRE